MRRKRKQPPTIYVSVKSPKYQAEPPYIDLVPQEQRELEREIGNPIRRIHRNGVTTIQRIPLSREERIRKESEARHARLRNEFPNCDEYQKEQQRMNMLSKISVIILFLCLVMMFFGFALIVFS